MFQAGRLSFFAIMPVVLAGILINVSSFGQPKDYTATLLGSNQWVRLPCEGKNTSESLSGVIVYTPEFGYRTRGSEDVIEVIVDRDSIVGFGVGESVIPENGFVISARGTEATTLMNMTKIGSRARYDPKSQEFLFSKITSKMNLPFTKDDWTFINGLGGKTAIQGSSHLILLFEQEDASNGYLIDRARSIAKCAPHPFVKWECYKRILQRIDQQHLDFRFAIPVIRDSLQVKLTQQDIDNCKRYYAHPLVRRAHDDFPVFKKLALDFTDRIGDLSLRKDCEQWFDRVEKQWQQASVLTDHTARELGSKDSWRSVFDALVNGNKWNRLGDFEIFSPSGLFYPTLGLSLGPWFGKTSQERNAYAMECANMKPFIEDLMQYFLEKPASEQVFASNAISALSLHLLRHEALTTSTSESERTIDAFAKARSLAFRLSVLDATFPDPLESVAGNPIWINSTEEKSIRHYLRKTRGSTEAIFRRHFDPLEGNLDKRDNRHRTIISRGYNADLFWIFVDQWIGKDPTKRDEPVF